MSLPTTTDHSQLQRRTATACLRCRGRKVRCDRTDNGLPCTNCRLDSTECIVVGTRRRQKPQRRQSKDHAVVNGASNAQPSLPSLADGDRGRTLSLDEPSWAFSELSAMPGSCPPTGGKLACAMDHFQTPGCTPEDLFLSNEPPDRADEVSYLETAPYVPPYLPPYIMPIPSTLSKVDVEYLRKNQVFTLPQPSGRDELVRCYFKFIHPLLPLIDFRSFVDAIEGQPLASPISLLLFWAVAAAAVAYIHPEHLEICTFKDRHSARKMALRRMYLLLETKLEKDPLVITQSLLLVNHWYDNQVDSTHLWQNHELTLSYVRQLFLPKSSGESICSEPDFHLRKRVFWSCYMHHCFICMAAKQPVRMDPDDFAVPMIEVADFEIARYPSSSPVMAGVLPPKQELLMLRELADISVGIARLCLCASQIWTGLYAKPESQSSGDDQPSHSRSPSRNAFKHTQFLQSEAALKKWHHKYAVRLLLAADRSVQSGPSSQYDQVVVARAVLTSLYLASIAALYRPQVFARWPHPSSATEIMYPYRQKICEAADSAAALYEYLLNQDLIRYQPNIGVAWLVSITILHVFPSKDFDPNISSAKRRRFQSCMKALGQMRDTYSSADQAYRFLESIQMKIDGSSNGAYPRMKPLNKHRTSYSHDISRSAANILFPEDYSHHMPQFASTDSLNNIPIDVTLVETNEPEQLQQQFDQFYQYEQQMYLPCNDFDGWTCDLDIGLNTNSPPNGTFEDTLPTLGIYSATKSVNADFANHSDIFMNTSNIFDSASLYEIDYSFEGNMASRQCQVLSRSA